MSQVNIPTHVILYIHTHTDKANYYVTKHNCLTHINSN